MKTTAIKMEQTKILQQKHQVYSLIIFTCESNKRAKLEEKMDDEEEKGETEKVKRKVGRPKKVKRKVGRPKGSKNKQK